MHAQNLLPHLEDLLPEAAERWVAAALAHAAALREHDDRPLPATRRRSALRTAEHLRAAWLEWADDADALLARAAAVGLATRGVTELDYAVARTRAMLKLTPQSLHERLEQVARGEVYTVEEVRSELGLWRS